MTFEEWKKDLSRVSKFDGSFFPGNVALVEVYRADVSIKKADIIIGYNSSNQPITTATDVSAQIKPVAKVLKLGNGVNENFKDLKVGSILRIPSAIQNEVPHPEYLTLLQVQGSNKEPKLPKGVNKTTTRFSHVWKDWMYPENPLEDISSLDTVTFLIPLSSATVHSYEA